MSPMLSSGGLRQRHSRSWFWAPKRQMEPAGDKAAVKAFPSEPIAVKPATWPRQRAIWMPPSA